MKINEHNLDKALSAYTTESEKQLKWSQTLSKKEKNINLFLSYLFEPMSK